MDSIDQSETKVEFIDVGDMRRRAYPVIPNRSFGYDTFSINVPVEEFVNRSLVPNASGIALGVGLGDVPSQRPINVQHALGLALYMLKGELHALSKRQKDVSEALKGIQQQLGNEVYYGLAPIVANLRPTNKLQVTKRDGMVVLIVDDVELFRVIDGQHRREARVLLIDWLKTTIRTGKYPMGRRTGPALFVPTDGRVDVTGDEMRIWGEVLRNCLNSGFEVSVHVDLDAAQERQLFYVLNNLGRAVEASLAFDFDQSNAVNMFIKDELIEQLKLRVTMKDAADRDEGEIALKDLVAVNAILFLNKTNIRSATPIIVQQRADVARTFWARVCEIAGFGQPGAKKATVATQPVVLKALAKLVHDFAFGSQQDEALLDTLLDSIPNLNLTHTNPIWRAYEHTPEVRESKFAGLNAYLPPEGTGNRDVGGFDTATRLMHFGAKHNDIYPIIGDMIRWLAKLPARQHKSKAVGIAA